MSTKHVRTTGDLLRFKCGLQVDCRGCGRTEIYDAMDVVRVFQNVELAAVRRRLRCERCGAKLPAVQVLSPPAPR